ncbi:hypothetical protein ACVMAJ_002440 [Bradyrhizobium sp. USDA 4448]
MPFEQLLPIHRIERSCMSANGDQGSAKIYQFPAGGRTALGRYRVAEPAAAAPRTREVVGSSGWYHEEAIRASRSKSEP